MAHLNTVSQEAVNLLTNIVYKDVRNMWLSDDFITDSSTSKSPDHYDVDIKHFVQRLYTQQPEKLSHNIIS